MVQNVTSRFVYNINKYYIIILFKYYHYHFGELGSSCIKTHPTKIASPQLKLSFVNPQFYYRVPTFKGCSVVKEIVLVRTINLPLDQCVRL